MTHNSGPLHRVIRAGAARRSTNASLMPRRTNCKPTTQQDEREEEEAGWEEAETDKEGRVCRRGGGRERKIEYRGDYIEKKERKI